MWNFYIPIESAILEEFETHFDFHITPPLRDFILTHNGGKTHCCVLQTSVRERRIESILDFSNKEATWGANKRMRHLLGNRIIVIGMDKSGNFLCVRRTLRNQEFVIWNHVTNSLEECTMEIPLILMRWQSEHC